MKLDKMRAELSSRIDFKEDKTDHYFGHIRNFVQISLRIKPNTAILGTSKNIQTSKHKL